MQGQSTKIEPPAGLLSGPAGTLVAEVKHMQSASPVPRRTAASAAAANRPLAVDSKPQAAGPPSRTDSRRLIGQRGEAIAADYLNDLGWRILDRNWRPGPGLRGEVDIVALQPSPAGPETLVIVEVKTRTSGVAGPPAAAVGPLKLRHLRSLAAAWAAAHPVPRTGLRLDVVSIQLREGLPALLRHHRGVGD
ncbi:YraN family protein [Actinomyces qiguomingii]|uniref:YraN family protein n=1 Tax=Actinomyces qiguomingii TaxID=2057800 RepID=UPI001E3FA06B|nr:YraN family protein [Actinomyces qiguomingii]